MPLGPGSYDDLAAKARVAANADGVILIIFGGDKGSGFSIQARGNVLPPRVVVKVLRDVADSIETETTS